MTKPSSGTPDPFRMAQALRRNAAATPPLRAAIEAPAPAADGGTRAEVWLYGVIGSFWDGLDAAAFADQIKAIEADTISLRVHSPGGSVFDGLAILNALRNHPARVEVTVDGLAASAASFIVMAGDEIRMSQGAQLMIHDAWAVTVGNAAEMRDMADWLDKQSQNIASIYASRAGNTAADWRTAMSTETWYSAEEAVAAGLADSVLPVPKPVPADGADAAAQAATGRTAWAAFEFDLTGFTFAGRDHAPAPQTPERSPRSGHPNQQEETAMAFTPEQLTTMRQELGLAETADEATIVAALSEALGERAEPTAAATVKPPKGMALVATDVLDQLRQGAEAGIRAAETLRAQRRDSLIEAAVRDGRITPARRDHWAAAYDADAEGTEAILAALAPGLVVNTAETGHGLDANDTTKADQLDVEDAEIAAFARSLGLSEEAFRG